jgi:hypothetical protein
MDHHMLAVIGFIATVANAISTGDPARFLRLIGAAIVDILWRMARYL